MPTTCRSVKNLQDGQIVIKDGAGTPKSLTLALDTGDLSWTQTRTRIQIKDRGKIVNEGTTGKHPKPGQTLTKLGSVRRGEQMPCQVSFSARWITLLGKVADASENYQPWEFLNFHSSLGLVSVAASCQDDALKIEFTVNDGFTSETITFREFYVEELVCGEGAESNTISCRGFDNYPFPLVARN